MLDRDALVASYYTLSGAPVMATARHPFGDRVRAAAAAGYDGIGLTLEDYEACLAGGASPVDLRALADDAGVVVAEIEFLSGWVDADDTSRAVEARLYEMADVFGAAHLNIGVSDPPGSLPPVDGVAERFAGVCNRAAEHGLRVALEFMPFFAVGDAAFADEIVELADRPNGGLLVDAYHYFRGSTDEDMLRAVPGGHIAAVQLSDAGVGDGPSIEETTTARMLPGEGTFDLVGLVRLLDEIGADAPFSVEILSTELQSVDVDVAAMESAEATRRVLAAARAS